MEDHQDTESTIKMIADYMEKGFLENIIDMFKHDKNLYPFIGDMLGDERMGVRIGTVALVESLAEEDIDNVLLSIPGIARLLGDENPTIRGDAAHVLGIIGHDDALPFLEDAQTDESEVVREAVQEAVMEIKNEGPADC
jgi:hypothetical protein